MDFRVLNSTGEKDSRVSMLNGLLLTPSGSTSSARVIPKYFAKDFN